MIATEFDPAAEAALREMLDQSRLFLLGETHGVLENPDIIDTLFHRFEFSALALEWDPGTELRAPFRSLDGRVTIGHFELLQRLRRERRLARLILFNAPGNGTWSGRDRAMAERLLAARQGGARTLVVAGNLHTPTRPHAHGHPMGARVAEAVPGTATGRIRYLGGEFFNFEVRRFRRPLFNRRRTARFYRRGEEFVYELPRAHAAQAEG